MDDKKIIKEGEISVYNKKEVGKLTYPNGKNYVGLISNF